MSSAGADDPPPKTNPSSSPIIIQSIFADVVIAYNPEDRGIIGQHAHQLSQQPVGVLTRPVKEVSQQHRQERRGASVLEAPRELVERDARVVITAKTWDAAREVRVTDEEEASPAHASP